MITMETKIEDKIEDKKIEEEENKKVEIPTTTNIKEGKPFKREFKKQPLRCYVCGKILSKDGNEFIILRAMKDGLVKKYFICPKELDYLGLDKKDFKILKWKNRAEPDKEKMKERRSIISNVLKEQGITTKIDEKADIEQEKKMTVEEIAEKHGWILKK